MAVQPFREILNTTALVAPIPTVTAGRILMQVGPLLPIVTEPMHSPQMQHNGVMKTTMVLVVINPETTQMSVQIKPVLQPKTVSAVLIGMTMVIPMPATRSRTMVRNGLTETVIIVVTIQTVQTQMHSQMTRHNG